ncbi:hypothetical protein [Burkholderia sp. RF2-non_BP3]|uniref:hypothetical protein n=1 Tax=Burkholderia sp. RF2-non_BP3 TaxID=1637844 RepID=UPI000B215A6A|nr:hypothetical protein [Burkholderia sp. RF2-non_BP3]
MDVRQFEEKYSIEADLDGIGSCRRLGAPGNDPSMSMRDSPGDARIRAVSPVRAARSALSADVSRSDPPIICVSRMARSPVVPYPICVRAPIVRASAD